MNNPFRRNNNPNPNPNPGPTGPSRGSQFVDSVKDKLGKALTATKGGLVKAKDATYKTGHKAMKGYSVDEKNEPEATLLQQIDDLIRQAQDELNAKNYDSALTHITSAEALLTGRK